MALSQPCAVKMISGTKDVYTSLVVLILKLL